MPVPDGTSDASETDTTETQPTTTDTTTSSSGDTDTGNGTDETSTQDGVDAPGLLRALAAERQARKESERQLSDLRKQAMTDQERAVADARTEGENAARERFQRRLLEAEVRSAAAGFKNPTLAVRLVDLDELLPDGDDDIDTKAVEAAVAQVLKDNPELAAKAGAPGRPPQGSRGDGGGTRPVQLARADLKSMTPQQIEKARKDGRLDDLLSGKSG